MTPPDLDPAAALNHPAVAGLAGSLIALRWAPGATWLMRAANIASGVALACVIVPVAG